MDPTPIASSPFAALSFVAAPALLTNASSVLALSTINRMLRTRDAMRELFAKSESDPPAPQEAERLIQQTNHVERQAALLPTALHAIYIALAAFACATLVTLLGASLSSWAGDLAARAFAGLGILLGFVGVGGLVVGCANLFQATQLSLVNIRDEAAVVRDRHQARKTPA